MNKVIVKKWVNGTFKKVQEFPLEDVKKIIYDTESIIIVCDSVVSVYAEACTIEFE